MPFPLRTFPPWLQNMVQSVAASTQTDNAMAAMCALGTLSATVASQVSILDAAGRSDPLNLWVLIIARSGDGKSSTFHPMVEPLETALRLANGDQVGESELARSDREGPPIRNRFERLCDDSYDPTDSTPDSSDTASTSWVTQEMLVESMRRGLDPTASVPDFFVGDVTPEALLARMAAQTRGLFQASSEGGFLSRVTASGARAVGQFAQLNEAWEAGTLRVDRVSRTEGPIVRAILTILAGPQPSAFAEITRGRMGTIMHRTGFLARCLFCVPETRMGSRRYPPLQIPADVQQVYRENIWALLIAGASTPQPPALLRLSPEASALSTDYYNRFEPRLIGDLQANATWANRLRQNVFRIAGLLHLADRVPASRMDALAEPISENVVERAIEIGEWLIPHGVRALAGDFPAEPVSARNEARVVSRPSDAILEAVLRAVENVGTRPFIARDVHRSNQRVLSGQDATTALEWLADQGRLTRTTRGRTMEYQSVEAAAGPSQPPPATEPVAEPDGDP